MESQSLRLQQSKVEEEPLNKCLLTTQTFLDKSQEVTYHGCLHFLPLTIVPGLLRVLGENASDSNEKKTLELLASTDEEGALKYRKEILEKQKTLLEVLTENKVSSQAHAE